VEAAYAVLAVQIGRAGQVRAEAQAGFIASEAEKHGLAFAGTDLQGFGGSGGEDTHLACGGVRAAARGQGGGGVQADPQVPGRHAQRGEDAAQLVDARQAGANQRLVVQGDQGVALVEQRLGGWQQRAGGAVLQGNQCRGGQQWLGEEQQQKQDRAGSEHGG